MKKKKAIPTPAEVMIDRLLGPNPNPNRRKVLNKYLETKSRKKLINIMGKNFVPWDVDDTNHFLKTSDEIRHGKTFTFKFLQTTSTGKVYSSSPRFVKDVTEKYCCKNMKASIDCYRFEPRLWHNSRTLEFEMNDDSLPNIKYCMFCGTRLKVSVKKMSETMIELTMQKAKLDPKKIRMYKSQCPLLEKRIKKHKQ